VEKEEKRQQEEERKAKVTAKSEYFIQ